MSTKLEESLRRPDWQPGAPLVLLNGETFHFRPPVVRLWRKYGPDGSFAYDNRTDLGLEYDVKLRDAETLHAEKKNIFGHIYDFADTMLTRNYREEIRDHYEEILYYSHDEKVKNLWWKIYDLGRGMDPKGVISIG
jgi:hypothetical protein